MGQGRPALKSIDIDILNDNGALIGAIQSFDYSQSRTVSELREINSGNYDANIEEAGEIVELVPGVASTTISVNGFALMGTESIQQMMFNRLANETDRNVLKTMKDNKTPFQIKEVQTLADGSTRQNLYVDCYLESYSRNISIEGDLVIAETASIRVRKEK